ncbi:MAG: hypothetical protein LIP01_10425 [Tannerellaceae bacterium]|nr:hypothetical protein [Tannerellaceae bacterium]
MTIQQLEKLASGLYRESGDSWPESTATNKEERMAHCIEHAIQHKTPLLHQLLTCQNKIEVMHLLSREYEDYDYGKGE